MYLWNSRRNVVVSVQINVLEFFIFFKEASFFKRNLSLSLALILSYSLEAG